MSGLVRVGRLMLLALLLTPGARADVAEEWVGKMNKAVHSLNYVGTYIYINGSNIDTMQIVHRVDGNGKRERLLSLNGEAREILRDSKKVTYILPANESVIVEQRASGTGLPLLVPENILELRALYHFALIGQDRIAGYPAVVIKITPKDKMRYGYRIWLEQSSGMVLRSDILDMDTGIIEQMMFTDITLPAALPEQMLRPTVEHEHFKVISGRLPGSAPPVYVEGDWSFVEMPKGFSVTGRWLKPMPMKKHPVHHFVLSDGLAAVSVYIEKRITGAPMPNSEASMGGVNVYTRQIADHGVVVMGEAPKATVKQIGEGVVKD